MSFKHLSEGITCHVWNADRSLLALCPNNNEIWIYSGCKNPDPKTWKKEHVLQEVSKYIIKNTKTKHKSNEANNPF